MLEGAITPPAPFAEVNINTGSIVFTIGIIYLLDQHIHLGSDNGYCHKDTEESRKHHSQVVW